MKYLNRSKFTILGFAKPGDTFEAEPADVANIMNLLKEVKVKSTRATKSTKNANIDN